ncbi:hypothetical protein Pmani_024533 [Petrolisthes manimaculis]|uniref:CUB domain-containing protein n=1 Tax=Petrolisthes manimaculis TaxID=1843537 RepID=A0AAE1U252_9EUCA|nr:hypothetical protein Pmani_024533 [Petrolisthes manimaculis]
MNGRRYYLEAGTRAEVLAVISHCHLTPHVFSHLYVIITDLHNPPLQFESDKLKEEGEELSLNQPLRCGAEFFTCPECHLEFSFTHVHLPSCSHDRSCRCDYVRVREPPYAGGGGGRDVCSTGGGTDGVEEGGLSFATQTREAIVDFLYARRYTHAFTLILIAKRNHYNIKDEGNITQGNIKSPYFPELYPKDHWMEYRLEALHKDTRIKVEDTNKTRLVSFSGNTFRPPILVSSGNHLTLRFSGNGETARGFNLNYFFVRQDCGGFVTNFGGTITMMNMAKGKTNLTLYDCVWIIQPPHNYAFKSHVSIKVVQFEEMGTQVEIRQGITSEDYLLETVRAGGTAETTTRAGPGGVVRAAGDEGGTKIREHVAAVDSGFYVRLKGAFSKDSKLAIAYTTFSYLGSCYSLTDLMCQNHRCVPKMLRCDGFDHCGDNSDEPASCYVMGPGNKSLTPEDAAWWYQSTPNYYFPQKSNFFHNTSHGWSGVLLLSSFIPSLSDGVEIFDAAADDPPIYEPPPDYEDVIKLILSGNNLKLVRRPGGVTAWVPDKLTEGGGAGMGQTTANQGGGDRPLRTRHASLDLEQGMEVVLWNASGFANPWSGGGRPGVPVGGLESRAPETSQQGHVRRSSLPSSPHPDVQRGPGHGVSIAPETITEAPEGIDSPLPAFRPIQPAISSPQISVRSFDYDSSGVSTPGTSTPRVLTPAGIAGRRLLKKGGRRRKKTSTTRRFAKREDSAPPSYEDAMQQSSCNQTPVRQPPETTAAAATAATAATAAPTTSGAAPASTIQVSESTQTSLDHDHDLTPTDRLRAAREMFHRISRDERETEVPRTRATAAARRPAAPAVRGRHMRSGSGGSSITRGTVRTRKAMLLRGGQRGGQRDEAECECPGACSCATTHSEMDMPTGGVKSKVNYYEANSERESDDAATIASTSHNTATKKRRLVRNKSAPAISFARHQPQTPAWSPGETDRGVAGEELERPLITPVTEVMPVVVAAGQDVVPSILERIHRYDQISNPGTPVLVPSHPTSPLPKTPGEEDAVKPGLVREAKSRIMTALQQDLPRLLPQDSDDHSDSPQHVMVPYSCLKNEEATTPDLPESLGLPPLRHDQAASIELWDACSRGRPSPVPQPNNSSFEVPTPSSGAVPKKQAVSNRKVTTGQNVQQQVVVVEHQAVLDKDVTQQQSITEEMAEQDRSHLKEQDDVKAGWNRSGLTLPLTDKFTPASVPVIVSVTARDKSYSEQEESEDELEVMNLGGPAGDTSEDESRPPSPHHLNITLNDTLDSDTDQEVPATHLPTSQHTHSQSQNHLQPRTRTRTQTRPPKKFPVPSPRGSKTTSASTVVIPVQRNDNIPEFPDVNCGTEVFPIHPRTASVTPHSCNDLTTPNPSTSVSGSSPTLVRHSPSPPSQTQLPMLSPQMVNSGVITIQYLSNLCPSPINPPTPPSLTSQPHTSLPHLSTPHLTPSLLNPTPHYLTSQPHTTLPHLSTPHLPPSPLNPTPHSLTSQPHTTFPHFSTHQNPTPPSPSFFEIY